MEGFDSSLFWLSYTFIIGMGVCCGMLAAWTIRGIARLLTQAFKEAGVIVAGWFKT